MVDVECVDVRAMIEQVGGDLDRAGEVERGLAVAAPGVHALWISLDELAQAVQAAEPRRGMNVHDGPALDGVLRQLEIAVCRKPNPPAHHWLLALMSAPAASSTSIIARLRALFSAGESKGPIGSLILVFNSGSQSSRSRARSASSARIDSMSWSTLERSDG